MDIGLDSEEHTMEIQDCITRTGIPNPMQPGTLTIGEIVDFVGDLQVSTC